MIYLLLDVLITSLTSFQTSFIIFDFKNKHNILYIIIVSLLVGILTFNIINIFIIFILYYLKKYIRNKYLLYIISFIMLFNIHINIVNLITFIISLIIIYYNPYN